MSQLIQLIRAYHGWVYETAGILIGYFDDPKAARSCASNIRHNVTVCGSQITIVL